MKLTAIAIDDEQVALSVIRTHVQQVPFLEVKEYFTDPFAALSYLEQEKVDLIFLDIKMPDISGLELMASLPGGPLVIFTTAYSEHAVQSFELDAVDYLLKPFSEERFMKACNKAKGLLEMMEKSARADAPNYVMVKSGYEQYKVFLRDILYLESAGNYISFVTKERKVLVRMSMQEAVALLPQELFTRVHRCFIVANEQVVRADRSGLYVGEVLVPVGAAYAEAVSRVLR